MLPREKRDRYIPLPAHGGADKTKHEGAGGKGKGKHEGASKGKQDWIDETADALTEDKRKGLVVQVAAPRDLDFERQGEIVGRFFVEKNRRDGLTSE